MALLYLLYQPLIGLLSLPLFRPTEGGMPRRTMRREQTQGGHGADSPPSSPAWYRGQLGVQSKWFFYVFYPAHLLGLWALGLALN